MAWPLVVLALLDFEELYIKVRDWIPRNDRLPETITMPDEWTPIILGLAIFGGAARAYHSLRIVPANQPLDEVRLAINTLQSRQFSAGEVTRSLKSIFQSALSLLAQGASYYALEQRIEASFDLASDHPMPSDTVSDIVNSMIIERLIDGERIQPPEESHPLGALHGTITLPAETIYRLTEFGKRVASRMDVDTAA